MAYTLFEKIKIGGFALGSAMAAGASAFAFTSLASSSVPLIVTLTVLGTTYSLLQTAHTKLQEVKKNRAKTEKIDKQEKAQQRQKVKRQALKQRIKDRLAKDKEEEKEELEEENVAVPAEEALLQISQSASFRSWI
jgi:uncharacterized membrane protein YhiD involved in acid resistance